MAKNHFLFIFIWSVLHLSSLDAELCKLLNWQQDFVLESRQIQIPGFPEAFNPSIVRWQGKLLMSFRAYDPDTGSTDLIGLVWLDDDFHPISTPSLLIRENEITTNPSEAQNPRLVVVRNKLFIVYSNLYPFLTPISRMYVGEIIEASDGTFHLFSPTALINFTREIRTRKEKNWVPFAYQDNLLLSYSLQPHLVIFPLLKENKCLTMANTRTNIVANTTGTLDWQWGTLRGGTPALLVDGSYLAFFQSNATLSSEQSKGILTDHYFMGAYVFEAEPPFSIKQISHHPIVARTFYKGPVYDTRKPLREIFPGGFIFDDNAIWVTYGRQEHEIWVVKLDKAKLMSSLGVDDAIK